MEQMSSGSPKMIVEGGELRVFGISVGAYFDAPGSVPGGPFIKLLFINSNISTIDFFLFYFFFNFSDP